jgi:hypothetical protein
VLEMPCRSRSVAASFAAAFVLSLILPVTGAAAYECEQQVNEALQEHRIDQSEVQSVALVNRGGSHSSGSQSRDAWVKLNSCSNGALVVHMTRYCMVQETYTTGDCRVGDMPSY